VKDSFARIAVRAKKLPVNHQNVHRTSASPAITVVRYRAGGWLAWSPSVAQNSRQRPKPCTGRLMLRCTQNKQR